MKTYVILRRNGWRTPEDLQQAAARSRQVGDEEMSDDIRWIRSYVFPEDNGSLATVCIYQASDEDAIRKHADAADLPQPRSARSLTRSSSARIRNRPRFEQPADLEQSHQGLSLARDSPYQGQSL
jgi:hypothetical protein